MSSSSAILLGFSAVDLVERDVPPVIDCSGVLTDCVSLDARSGAQCSKEAEQQGAQRVVADDGAQCLGQTGPATHHY